MSTARSRARDRDVIARSRPWPLGKATGLLLVFTALAGASSAAHAQFIQQGAKITAGDEVGTGEFGNSVALSADGNTLIVGGPLDNNSIGAAWVFTRSGNVWSEQAKLVAGDAVGKAGQGQSVGLCADGNTAIVGGADDSGGTGAAWIWTRSGGTWTEQQKLIGSGSANGGGGVSQGWSVALSGDCTAAAVGGPNDNFEVGAAWVFTQSAGTWSQLGAKAFDSNATSGALGGWSIALPYSGAFATGNARLQSPDAANFDPFLPFGEPGVNHYQGDMDIFYWAENLFKFAAGGLFGTPFDDDPQEGWAVTVSGDADTTAEGGPDDNNDAGAVWVFTQSNGTFTQQGSKLVGSGGDQFAEQGYSLAMSGDGNTLIEGGPYDNLQTGAAWIFSRTNGTWTQQGAKLVGSGGVTSAYGVEQGWSVALSTDGNTAAVAGVSDNSAVGAVWIFVRATPTNTHDFDDTGVSDILWRDTSGTLALWLMSGGQLSSGADIASVPTIWSVAGMRDFNGDGDADILWQDNAGDVAIWLMNGTTFSSGISLGNIGSQWSVAGTGDFNADGTGDILWRNSSTGDAAIWLMSNGQLASGADLGAVPTTWQIAGTGDFNGNGTSDILWRNSQTGDLAVWFLQNGQFSSGADLGVVPLAWTVVGTGDFNGDGTTDILWRDTSGDLAVWLISNGQLSSGADLGQIPTTWSVAETGDFDGNGTSDILWTDQSGDLAVWLMNGLMVSSYNSLGNVGTTWTVQGQNAD